MGATAGITAWVTAVGRACVPIMPAVETGKTATLAVGIVAVTVVGDVPELVDAIGCALGGPPRPFVITPFAVAKAAGNGEAEAAGISMICK